MEIFIGSILIIGITIQIIIDIKEIKDMIREMKIIKKYKRI